MSNLQCLLFRRINELHTNFLHIAIGQLRAFEFHLGRHNLEDAVRDFAVDSHANVADGPIRWLYSENEFRREIPWGQFRRRFDDDRVSARGPHLADSSSRIQVQPRLLDFQTWSFHFRIKIERRKLGGVYFQFAWFHHTGVEPIKIDIGHILRGDADKRVDNSGGFNADARLAWVVGFNVAV